MKFVPYTFVGDGLSLLWLCSSFFSEPYACHIAILMKQMVSFLVFLFFTSGCCCAQDVKGRMEMPEITKDDVILDYTGFTVSYNCETLTPKWVAYVDKQCARTTLTQVGTRGIWLPLPT